MWLVKLTPTVRAKDAGAKESVHLIDADDVDSFFKWRGEWRWRSVEDLMQSGLIARAEIDYKPGVLGS
jgi:hypothetical protein